MSRVWLVDGPSGLVDSMRFVRMLDLIEGLSSTFCVKSLFGFETWLNYNKISGY
jgi:hypothetical protein